MNTQTDSAQTNQEIKPSKAKEETNDDPMKDIINDEIRAREGKSDKALKGEVKDLIGK